MFKHLINTTSFVRVIQNTSTTSSFTKISNVRHFAKPAAAAPKKKKLGKLGPIVEKKILPVETDPYKLTGFVCGSNILKTGEDIKIKADSEYPEWLWRINVNEPLKLEEMDPDTKQYWRKLRKMALRRNNQLQKLKKF